MSEYPTVRFVELQSIVKYIALLSQETFDDWIEAIRDVAIPQSEDNPIAQKIWECVLIAYENPTTCFHNNLPLTSYEAVFFFLKGIAEQGVDLDPSVKDCGCVICAVRKVLLTRKKQINLLAQAHHIVNANR